MNVFELSPLIVCLIGISPVSYLRLYYNTFLHVYVRVCIYQQVNLTQPLLGKLIIKFEWAFVSKANQWSLDQLHNTPNQLRQNSCKPIAKRSK